MTDRPGKPTARDARAGDLAPETRNPDQDDAPEQAQTVAEQSRAHAAEAFRLEDSEKVSTGSPSDDEQDLVDHMRQMENGARIDMDAYRGEPNFDDDEDKYGEGAKEDDLPGDGS